MIEVVRDSPPGHYLKVIGDEAQIIAVRSYQGEDAYRDAVPGFVVTEIHTMQTPPEVAGDFISIMFRREIAE